MIRGFLQGSSNHLLVTQGASLEFVVNLVDKASVAIPSETLLKATASFVVREQPSDVVDVLAFNTTDNPTRISIDPVASTLTLSLQPADTNPIDVGAYFYELRVTVDDEVSVAIEWNLFSLSLGGAAPEPTPPFDNTTKVDHDYQLPGDLAYMTPGGSPVEGAQIRLYYKSDYDAGNLTAPVGITTTDAGGRWKNPILVKPGYSYVVRFEKPNEWGPDTAEIFA